MIAAYLGERPAISVNKCTLRRVDPDTRDAAGTRTELSSATECAR